MRKSSAYKRPGTMEGWFETTKRARREPPLASFTICMPGVSRVVVSVKRTKRTSAWCFLTMSRLAYGENFLGFHGGMKEVADTIRSRYLEVWSGDAIGEPMKAPSRSAGQRLKVARKWHMRQGIVLICVVERKTSPHQRKVREDGARGALEGQQVLDDDVVGE
ncbi:hypothetical protein FA95DRAFT_676590 [Auriscalpium vulgare]|uniref:Uncharacterized protein n=1 Tax=Auriscalpium vulgare TaxID=40419 RepID=A0ACB8RC26_9AGAM|nr:hypothetical protein FA95DRAFT_676590 [Auriscalpium vulgare]